MDPEKIVLTKLNSLEVVREGNKFFAIYDAGAHIIIMRKDEISSDDAKLAQKGISGAIEMLFKLQRRLKSEGYNPSESNYESNYESN
jgi:hypothetical protein